MERIDAAQRRARLARRHHLAAGHRAADPVTATGGVVALHSTDPASVFISLWARTDGIDVSAIEYTLYQRRALIRMHGMRRTLFVVPTELAPVVQAACTNGIAARQRERYGALISDGGGGGADWLRQVEAATLEALTARGEATGAQLSADVPALRTQLRLSVGKPYESVQNITTWVLFLLAADGRIVRGRPRGSWINSQYTWAPMRSWLPEGLPVLPVDEAQIELVRRWLAAFGPGTVKDLRWWTGLSAREVRAALATIGPVEVDLGGATGLVLPDDVAPVPEPEPWVALLPALDPTAMGWTERSWYVSNHAPALFDRSGNIGPTVWSDGRVVGGWAMRTGGEVVYRLLEDVGRHKAATVAEAAARLSDWVGSVKVTPRFRTPLEKELAA